MDETLPAALARELQEELGVAITVGALLAVAENAKYRLSLFRVEGSLESLSWTEHDCLYWSSLPVPSFINVGTLDQQLLPSVAKHLK